MVLKHPTSYRFRCKKNTVHKHYIIKLAHFRKNETWFLNIKKTDMFLNEIRFQKNKKTGAFWNETRFKDNF